MINILCGIVMVCGALISFIAALGMLRMPDLLMRMHAGTKAGTLGVSLMLLATLMYFGTLGVMTKSLIAMFFTFITVPIGAQMLGRAAYFIKTPLWKETVVDELRDHYDKQSHELK